MDFILKILSEFWSTFEAMAPYLLLGFGIAGVLSVLISAKTVEKHLGGSKIGSVIKASLFGVPLPLCSCSVIPVTASLRKHGAGRGATMAFLLSTPQTGVDSIMVTYALLGPVLAVFRPIAAFLTGLIGGAVANLIPDGNSIAEQEQTSCKDGCCSTSAEDKPNIIWQIFNHGFITLPRDVGRSMLIGVLIAGAITAFVPDNLLAKYLGGGILSLFAMMLFGIPVYVCATASVPIAAALILKGVSPGAALVFLMTGPATNAAGIAAVWKMMGPRTVAVYLITTAATALASGLIFDRFMEIPDTILNGDHGETMPPLLRTILAITLIIVLIAPSIPLPHKKKAACCSNHDKS
jgi:uncharacterized membrane protein YraQ (UPF0718 family)